MEEKPATPAESIPPPEEGIAKPAPAAPPPVTEELKVTEDMSITDQIRAAKAV